MNLIYISMWLETLVYGLSQVLESIYLFKLALIDDVLAELYLISIL
jgi:hypothetical protein